MKKLFNFKIYILILLLSVVVTAGFRCTLLSSGDQQLLQPIALTWWGTFDDSENFSEIIADYQISHPNVSISYRKLRPEEFDQQLVDALAEDRGPDIFSIDSRDLAKWLTKIEPLPPTTKMAYLVKQKSLGIKEETLTETRETTSITAGKLKETFADVVYGDVVKEGKIYGLPLSLDTLVMFYNRDLFNNAGLPLPPTTWTELQADTKKLTTQDKEGKLIQAGVAMGTANNVTHLADIVSLLMIQNGADMIEDGHVVFNVLPPTADKTYNPGPEAVRFYTDFSNPLKEVYGWNDTLPTSLDAFAQSRVAIFFGYNSDISYLETKRQGKLNYGIAKMPQIEGRETNVADYWLQTVAKKSKHINEAWDFLQFMSTRSDETKKYLAKTMRPTALRALIAEQLNNDQLNPFASQVLTSKNWYQGQNYPAAENAFKEMINAINLGSDFDTAVGVAAKKIQQTL